MSSRRYTNRGQIIRTQTPSISLDHQRCETREKVAGPDRLAQLSQSKVLQQQGTHRICAPAVRPEIDEAYGTVSFGQTLTVGTKDQRYVGVTNAWKAKLLAKPSLPRRGQQQVIGPNDLADILRRIINHDRQVVGEYAVISDNHEVVHRCLHGPAQVVDNRDHALISPHSLSRTTTGINQPSPLMRGEMPTRSGVGPIRQRLPIRCRSRITNFASGTKARIGAIGLYQPADGFSIELGARRLKDNLTVPVDADRREVSELLVSQLASRDDRIEVFHSHRKPATARTSKHPRQQRSAQISKVK